MWTVVNVAIGKDRAEEIEKKLKNVGFLVKVNFFAMDGKAELYEILVPEFEAEDIQEVLLELGII